MLIPGRYEVEFLGRGWGYGTAEPIEVVAGQTAEFELIPVRRRR